MNSNQINSVKTLLIGKYCQTVMYNYQFTFADQSKETLSGKKIGSVIDDLFAWQENKFAIGNKIIAITIFDLNTNKRLLDVDPDVVQLINDELSIADRNLKRALNLAKENLGLF